MSSLFFETHRSPHERGSIPGTPTYIGAPREHKTSITTYRYNLEEVVQEVYQEPSQLPPVQESPYISWIDVNGIHDVKFMEKIREHYKLHPLVLEDIVNTTLRPQLEEYENGIFLVLKMISHDPGSSSIQTEHISLFLGHGFVLTFQEKPGDVLDPLRKRLLNNLGRLRKKNADYLFYALVDVIVDHYFLVLEGIEEEITELEERLHDDDSNDLLQEIQEHKRQLIFLRKSIVPLREVMNHLNKLKENPLFEKKTWVFIRDLHSQLSQVLEMVETYREVLTNLYDLHFALTSHRMNEVMKLLTVVSTIFIPLTFIAGIYGMNFSHMPELTWSNGYFAVLGLMLLITIVLLILFRRRSWI